LTKSDLIERLSNRSGMPNSEAERVVERVLEDIINALKAGDRVNISGFGTFTVSARSARIGRNPKTGESIAIAASRTTKFKAGKQMKESLMPDNGGDEPSGSIPD
jgi:nucleoid DNA-binding protein